MRNLRLIVLLPFLVMALSGWFWDKKKEDVPLVVGIWKSTKPELQGLQLSFDLIGSFKVDFINGETDDIIGDYQMIADKIIFEDNRPASDTFCRDKAYYYFKFVNGELWLSLIADGCSTRRKILLGRWSKVEAPEVKNDKTFNGKNERMYGRSRSLK